MRIPAVLVLTACLFFPRTARAQIDYWWGPTLRVTPFVATSPIFTQFGHATVVTDDGLVTVRDVETRVASGFGFGVSAEWRVVDALTIIGGGLWSSRGHARLLDLVDSASYEMPGSDFWLVKAGLALQLRDDDDELLTQRVYGNVYVAPALMIGDADSASTTPGSAVVRRTHPALNMGATAEVPFWDDRVAFMVSAEDYLVFWNHGDARDPVAAALRTGFPGSSVTFTSNRTHIWFFRFGVSWYF